MSTLTYTSQRPSQYSEKIENFVRTSSENFYQNKYGNTSSVTGSGGLLNGFGPGSLASRLATFPSRDIFELYVDVPHFKADEVSVSTDGDLLIVSGKHEEKHPQMGYQSKEFTNKYTMPKNVDKGRMSCVFKDRGYLKIEAPLIREEDPNARTIPIKILDEPAKTNGTTIKTASNSSVSTSGSSNVSHV